MKLRVGLVGLGDVWQTRHAPALRTMSDRFKVHAVCDQVAHRAEQVAAEFNADAVDGYRTLAMREDIDAVLLLSPQWYGALPILAACESGKAVYCAAGLDLELEEAQLVKNRVVESGIAFMAEFPRRHAPATIRLKELIATRLGQPRLRLLPSTLRRPARRALPARSPARPFFRQPSGGTGRLVLLCGRSAAEPGNRTHASNRLQRRGRRLSDDEPRFFGTRPSRAPARWRKSAAGATSPPVAGGHHLSPAGRHASLLQKRHRLCRSARHAGLVRRGRPARRIARQRTPHRRATADPLLSGRHQPRPPHQRSGRRLPRIIHSPPSPPQPPGRPKNYTIITLTSLVHADYDTVTVTLVIPGKNVPRQSHS